MKVGKKADFLEEDVLHLVWLYVQNGLQKERTSGWGENHFRRTLTNHLLKDKATSSLILGCLQSGQSLVFGLFRGEAGTLAWIGDQWDLYKDWLCVIAVCARIEHHWLVIEKSVCQYTAISAQLLKSICHCLKHCFWDEVQRWVVCQADQCIYLPCKELDIKQNVLTLVQEAQVVDLLRFVTYFDKLSSCGQEVIVGDFLSHVALFVFS